jgi:hypothetical protein
VVKVILVLCVALSFTSLKSSPMLSMLLSVKELESLVILEVLLPCVWKSSSLLCICYRNCPSTETMDPILHHIIITNFSCHSCCCLIFHRFYSTSHIEKCTKTPLQIEVPEIIFPTSHHSHETGSEQESCAYFTPAMQTVRNFQNVQHSMFLPYLLVRVFKFLVLGCIGIITWWSFWFLTFLPLYRSKHMLKPWGNNDFPLKPCRWLTILIAIGQ